MGIPQASFIQARLSGLFATLGIISHLLYFIRGEHHLQAVRLAQISAISPCLIFLGLYRWGDFTASFATATTVNIFSSFMVGLWSSMLVYRAFFHPLRTFPGPYGAKLSKLWHLFQLRNLDGYKKLDMWHHKYGDYVRTGPGELSIFDPDAVDAIMGAKSKCTRTAWYDMGQPLVSMLQCRDRAVHDKRRRTWDRGFSMKALGGYESRVKRFTDDLVEQIASFEGKPVNVSKWFNYYSFDVMGELSFGESFNMLKSGETHDAIHMLDAGQKPLGMIGPVPWLMIIFCRIPGLSAGYQRWIAFCEKQAEKRKQMDVKERDVMSWLLDAEPMSSDPFENHMWLVGDARLIIVAGSDTTAATLTHAFYHLARDQQLADKIRHEVTPLLQEDGTFDIKELANADFLNGFINEVLRLHPPVPSGVLRLTPPEGLEIGDIKIPGETTVTVPLWTVGRSPKAFKRPEDLIPERWYSQPDLVIKKEAYAPFSIGRYGCIGKNLALMELRTVVASFVTKFDVVFAPNENGYKLLNETQDYFTLGLSDLMLQFHARKT